jgi:hypothetical protein
MTTPSVRLNSFAITSAIVFAILTQLFELSQ